MEWLQHDGVEADALPSWAQGDHGELDGAPYRVRARAEGLALVRPRGSAALGWEDILVPVRLERPRRLLVAAARRPPRPPWFELGGRDVDEIERAIRARLQALEHQGYRQRRRVRDTVPADEVLRRVLERSALPGAVEIPAAHPGALRGAALGGAVAGLTGGFYGMMVSPAAGLVAGLVGLAGGALAMGSIDAMRKRRAGRVLVLTPDAFVGGLDGRRVRAVSWDRVGAFAAGRDDDRAPALEVRGTDGALLARVAARWFGAPLDVIVAVAEAYRERAST